MLDLKLKSTIKSYCATFPNEESGGVIDKGVFLPLPNFAENKRQFYQTEYNGIPEFIVHSHLKDSAASDVDIMVCNKLGVPFVIYSLLNDDFNVIYPQTGELPYVGRPYICGLIDCLELVRDYYSRELNILIPEYDGKFRFFHRQKRILLDPNLNSRNNRVFIDFFERSGFAEIPLSSIRKNDLVIVNSDLILAPHGCGVYLGNNKILEHQYNQKSSINLVDLSNHHIISVLRHNLCN